MARAILKASKKLQEKMEKKRISEKPIRPKKSFRKISRLPVIFLLIKIIVTNRLFYFF
jgi:hypothetical protein